MEILWKSYGVPMEFLWNNTRATRERRAYNASAGGLRYLTRRPAALERLEHAVEPVGLAPPGL